MTTILQPVTGYFMLQKLPFSVGTPCLITYKSIDSNGSVYQKIDLRPYRSSKNGTQFLISR